MFHIPFSASTDLNWFYKISEVTTNNLETTFINILFIWLLLVKVQCGWHPKILLFIHVRPTGCTDLTLENQFTPPRFTCSFGLLRIKSNPLLLGGFWLSTGMISHDVCPRDVSQLGRGGSACALPYKLTFVVGFTQSITQRTWRTRHEGRREDFSAFIVRLTRFR